jgi:hypothetical protein
MLPNEPLPGAVSSAHGDERSPLVALVPRDAHEGDEIAFGRTRFGRPHANLRRIRHAQKSIVVQLEAVAPTTKPAENEGDIRMGVFSAGSEGGFLVGGPGVVPWLCRTRLSTVQYRLSPNDERRIVLPRVLRQTEKPDRTALHEAARGPVRESREGATCRSAAGCFSRRCR